MKTSGRRLFGKIALVTGAGRGIGRAVALSFAREGADIILCSRTLPELREASSEVESFGVKALPIVCDVSSREEIRSMISRGLKLFERIDILINNAGILGPHKPLTDVSTEDWERTLQVNLNGAFFITQEVMRASMLPRKKGCVVNLTSSLGRKGRAGWGPYAASKFGLEAITQVWADECRDDGIRFYAVNPAGTRTNMRSQAYPDEDPSSVKPPELVGEAFVHLAVDDSPVPTGSSLDLDRVTGQMSGSPRPC
jgi:NAD(P)-dependent dehydrogenase (short-subunit alcohol dehydrogenase family)